MDIFLGGKLRIGLTINKGYQNTVFNVLDCFGLARVISHSANDIDTSIRRKK